MSPHNLISILVAVAVPASLAGQSVPTFPSEGIVSSSDSSSASLGLARGSLFTIYGSNLASSTASASAPYPTVLADATVHFRSYSGDALIDAPLLYASPSQINGIVPPGFVLPPGVSGVNAYMSVETAAGEGQKYPVMLVDSRFSAFATGLLPFGPALVQQYRRPGITLNRLLDPAVPGDALVIWGTGLGSAVRQDVTVYVGGVAVTPFYAGPAPGQPGLSQINFYLPSDTPSRCFTPLAVVTGAQVSAMYTISTAPAGGSDCQSDIPLSHDARQTLDQGGAIRLATLAVTTRDTYGTAPLAEAWQAQYTSAYLSQVANYDAPGVAPIVCTRSSFNSSSPPPIPPLPAQFYGLGPSVMPVSVTGPGACSWPFSGAYVLRAWQPQGCPAQQFVLGDAASGGPLSGALPAVPSAAVPEIHVSRSATAIAVSWSNASGARLTLEIGSEFSMTGGAIGGRSYGQQLTCQLSGSSGSGEISNADFSWAQYYPSWRWISYHLSPAATIYAPWSAPISAALVRSSRVLSGQIALQ